MFSFGLNFQTIHHEISETIPPLPISMLFLKILFSSSSFEIGGGGATKKSQKLLFAFTTFIQKSQSFCGEL